MDIISLRFLILVIISLIAFYITPLRVRRYIIVIFNFAFLFLANDLYQVIGIVLCMVITYISAIIVEKKVSLPLKKTIVVLSVVIIASMMVLLKDSKFFGLSIDWVAPLGISYYTLSCIGYILDVYWGVDKAEKNPLRFFMFAGYYPIMTSGPIISYKDRDNIFPFDKRFEYEKFCFGAQRVLWGLFKKMVIAARVATWVDAIYGDYHKYAGIYIWIAVILFVIQLYADFSGCIDIVLGISEMFGFKLPENFNLPFLAKNLSVFWRKWHITLGEWLRSYIFYPILKSRPFQKIGKATKKRFGKRLGKKIPVWLSLVITWFLIGFWHGGAWNYIFGVGLFMAAIIILGEMLEPLWKYIIKVLHINTDTKAFKAFQIIRTWIFFTFGLSFFRSYNGLREGFDIWKEAFSTWNINVLWNGDLLELGLDLGNIIVMFFSILVLIIISIIRSRSDCSVRQLIASKNIVFRWACYLILLVVVIIYGQYAIEFDASAFIYGKF